MKNLFRSIAVGTLLLFSQQTLFAQTSSWTTLTSGITTDLYGVSTVDANTVYVCGEAGKVLKTTNGGISWSPLTTGVTQDLYSVCFVDANTGVAVGTGGVVIRTTDGGANWSSLSVTTNDLRNIWFMLDNVTGYISGGVSAATGCVYKTTNAGVSWAPVPNPSANVNYSTFFDSPVTGFFCNGNGQIHRTTDGGFSWSPVASGVSSVLYVIASPSFLTAVAVGLNGKITRTTNAGSSWTVIPSGTTDALCGVSFCDANTGFIMGGNPTANTGTILQTSDAGATWSPYTITSKMLYRVDMLNLNIGYAVGFDGTIIKYTSNVGLTENNTSVTFSVYPNPTSGPITIEVDKADVPENMRLEVTDLRGKLIMKKKIKGNEKFVLENVLSSGTYLVNLISGEKIMHTEKVVAK